MTIKLLTAYSDQSWSYENFFPNGRLHIVCPHCRALILLFDELSPAAKHAIACTSRSDRAAAMQMLREVSGCDLLQAKANVLHIRGDGSDCHKCLLPLPPGAL